MTAAAATLLAGGRAGIEEWLRAKNVFIAL